MHENRRRVVLVLVVALLAAERRALAQAQELLSFPLPEAKRAYQLLVPPAAAREKDLPLVVYLHPAGNPNFAEVVRDWWPMLRERKCLLALPKSEGKDTWLSGEEAYLDQVLRDVQKRYPVDAKRILLLGACGGGNVALFLADHEPQRYRAVIVLATSPVTIRGDKMVLFYPARAVLRTCPYFVINHLSQGSALMYWRQVQAQLEPLGASLTIWPTLGAASGYRPPPPELAAWLDEVLAGKHPAPPPDPQRLAVVKMFQPCAEALPEAIRRANSSPVAQRVTKDGRDWRLSVGLPEGFQRLSAENAVDSAGRPITQVRIGSKKWPLFARCGAQSAEKPMDQVLADEELLTIQRGLLYQLYGEEELPLANRLWKLKIGSITYPDQRRGWVSSLFLLATAPIAQDKRQWLEVMLLDETQQPGAEEMAGLLKTVLGGLAVEPSPPATAPASGPASRPTTAPATRSAPVPATVPASGNG